MDKPDVALQGCLGKAHLDTAFLDRACAIRTLLQCEQGKRHKKITHWARQMIFQLKRWLPGRLLIIVADSSYAGLELLSTLKDKVSFITRLRPDAALYDMAPARQPGKRGPNCRKGERQPTLKERLDDPAIQWQTITIAQWYNHKDKQLLAATDVAIWYHSGMTPVEIRWVLIKDAKGKSEPAALLCANIALNAEKILAYFIRRWAMEVTPEESRAHLGIESQRQWSDKAIERTTPALMGLFSMVALWADQLHRQQRLLEVEHTAWYHKDHVTFADAIAAVRSSIWKEGNYYTSTQNNDMINIPKSLFDQLTNLITRAA
jgi:hypothetical protein